MLLRLSNLICGLLITMGLVLHPSSASGGFVNIMTGYDLLRTREASFNFHGAGGLGVTPFVGVPLGTYNFGGGNKDTWNTDTLVHRLDPVTNLSDGASQTIDIEMVALSLQSQNQINWSAFGGNASEYVKVVNVVDNGSTMTITNSVADLSPLLENGTFDSIIKITFGLQGVDSGATLGNISKTFSQTGALWSHLPPPGILLIDSVNNKLNGSNHLNDFFPTGSGTSGIVHETPFGDIHIVDPVVPEPTSLFAIGLACMAAGGRFANRRRLKQTT
jgi:hypothetical protein